MSQTDIKQKDPLLTLMKEIKEYARAYSRNPCEAKDHKEPVCAAIRDYAAEQIELDRQRRGEPVAWRYLTPTGWHATTDAAQALRVAEHHTVEPLYAAPQPAEPVKVPSDSEMAAKWNEKENNQ